VRAIAIEVRLIIVTAFIATFEGYASFSHGSFNGCARYCGRT
jgi:hypothetical protein